MISRHNPALHRVSGNRWIPLSVNGLLPITPDASGVKHALGRTRPRQPFAAVCLQEAAPSGGSSVSLWSVSPGNPPQGGVLFSQAGHAPFEDFPAVIDLVEHDPLPVSCLGRQRSGAGPGVGIQHRSLPQSNAALGQFQWKLRGAFPE